MNDVGWIDIPFDKKHVFGAPYPDGEKWYLASSMNVYDDDIRSDRKIISEIITTLRREDSDDIAKLVKRAGGVCSAVEIVVYRQPRKGGLGQYTSGIVVFPEQLLDETIDAETIVEESTFHKEPRVVDGTGWRHLMMDEFNSGKFIPKKDTN